MADNKTSNSPVSILADRRTTRPRTGAQILVDQLLIHGVETAYCVPGESYLAVLDALYDTREQIRLIVCRQEAAPPIWPTPTANSLAGRASAS